LLKSDAPEKSMLFRKGIKPLLDVAKRQSTTVLGAVITLSLLLGVFAPMMEASGLSASDSSSQGPTSGIIKVNGTNLELNGTILHFLGINDQTVIPLNLYPYPQYNYRYHNHLFPAYVDDVTTKLPSDNYADFWFQYFWLCHSIGLNMVRLGAFDAWSLGIIHSMWENDRPTWDSIIDPMLAMAEVNDIYIDWCFGGSNDPAHQTFDAVSGAFGEGMTVLMAGNIYDVGSACYNEYASFIGEVMTEYKNSKAIAMWDLCNEPDHDLVFDRWWSAFPNPRSAYQAWAEDLTTKVLAADPSHIVTIGAMYNGKLFPWGESSFDVMSDNAANVTDHHMYSSTNSDLREYWISDRKNWSDGLSKPIFISEFGYGQGGIYYYPWAAQRMEANDYAGYCMMALWEYPGYPISQAVMDSIPAPPAYTPPVVIKPPSAPAIPMAAAGVGSVELTWSVPTSNGGADITGYNVYRATSAGGEGSVPITTLGVTYSWTDSDLAAGSTFYYRFTALNSAGEGSRSAEVSATTPTVPSAPMNLAATSSNGQVTISWQAPQSDGGRSVTSYSILRGTQSGAETMLNSTSGTNYTDDAVANGQAYYYIVKASNAVGTGPASNEVSAMPKAVPFAPTSLSATGGVGSITLSWSAPTSNGGSLITGYNVYRGSSAGNERAVPVAALTDAYSWTDPGLPGASTFYYCVSAINAVGEGARSTEVFASTPGAPGVPVYLNAQASNNSVLLTWTDPTSNGGSSITAYRIYMATDEDAESLLISLGASEHSYNVTGLLAGHAYTFRLSAVNAIGEGPQSLGVTMTLPNASIPERGVVDVQPGSGQTISLTLGGAAVALVATMGCFVIWYRKKD